ncbi:mechanosensitive ion channel family protein [Halobacteria archaeon AArc-m2/3/4]|uniref:Mechanosensitive ion channel family protein n=1 Tax=Natronoglomus mannanivorans TaxID=2979990 RepID=A0AAP2YX71_9EURY|nr:mechanosensitive ion channel family protein [Halobacteria archaeon AArc-xg1-1]MCU4972788.1 mechanosensitive ion channel family protein [Halobacteria archaeon AArc-m2/3/4]
MRGVPLSVSTLWRPLQSDSPLDETVAIVAIAIVTGAAIWYFGKRLKTQFQTEDAEVVRAGLLLALTSVVTVVLLMRWSATSEMLSIVGIVQYGVDAGVRVLLTVVLFAAAYTVTRVLKRLLLSGNRSSSRTTSAHQRRVTFYVSQVGIYIAAVVGSFSLWGIQLSNLLFGAGVLGIILGLAFQNTLGSILAGFVLMLSRPFDVGHWVRIGDHEGFITEITINHVRLRNLDGEHVVLPNEAVSNRTIVNRSVEGKLRQRVEVGVDYDVDPAHAESVAIEAIEDLDEILTQPAPQVFPIRFDDSAVILELRFWIGNPTPQRKWRAVQAVIHSVKTTFESEGVKIPFPQRELTGRAETGGFRVADDPSSEYVYTERSEPSTTRSE